METSSFVIVTIDGGAASGKSSTSKALSKRFGLLHVDTGSHYRFITHQLLEAGTNVRDTAVVAAALEKLVLGTRIDGLSARPELNGKTAGEEIRRPAVNEAVSTVAAQPAVRQFLLQYQRSQVDVARSHGFPGLVMEGRDIGSVIFPDARFRYFLQADPAARARRRADQGEHDSIQERDRMDSERKTAPLHCPPGATLIDSTDLTLNQVVDAISGDLDAILTRRSDSSAS